MAAHFESGFFVKVPAWHKLGNLIQNAPSIAEGIKLAGMDWQVILERMLLADGKEVPNAFASIRNTDRSVLGVVGDRYTPIQNEKMFEFFEPFVASGEVELETAGSLKGGKVVFVMAKLTRNTPIEVVKGDYVEKNLLLAGSHDGSLKTSATFTPTRVVCANTLAIALNQSKSISSTRHTKNYESRLAEIQTTINMANQSFDRTADQYRLLSSRQISKVELIEYIKNVMEMKVEESGAISTRSTNILESILNRFETSSSIGRELVEANDRRIELERKSNENLLDSILGNFEAGKGSEIKEGRGTWWNAYNAVTEHLTHAAGRTEENRLASNWFGDNAKTNELALTTAVNAVA